MLSVLKIGAAGTLYVGSSKSSHWILVYSTRCPRRMFVVRSEILSCPIPSIMSSHSSSAVMKPSRTALEDFNAS